MWLMFFKTKFLLNFFYFFQKNENIATKYFSRILYFQILATFHKKRKMPVPFDRKIRNRDSNSNQNVM